MREISLPAQQINEAFKPIQESMNKATGKLGEAMATLKPVAEQFQKGLNDLAAQVEAINNTAKQNMNAMPATALSGNQGLQQPATCPICPEQLYVRNAPLKTIIIHLNDSHQWTREKIADWLDTLPNQPIYYPDIRTDDEKIEDAKKQPLFSSGWAKSPQISMGTFNMQAGDSLKFYESGGKIQDFGTAQGACTWSVTINNYQGGGYVEFTSAAGNVTKHYPNGTISW